MTLRNKSKHTTVVNHLEVAESFIQRAKGLLGRKSLEPDAGLWIRPCSDIHTWFMRFNFDAVFVDAKLIVHSIHPDLKPWRFIWQSKANSVFELPQGKIVEAKIEVGDQLDVVN